MKTPGNGPGCPNGDVDDAATTRPSDCRNPKTFVVAWGTETNVYEHLGPGEDLDIFITRSTDKGVTYEPYQVLAGAQSPSFNELDEMESQLRVTPDGKSVFAVWNERGEEIGTNGRFAMSVETKIPVEPEPDAGVPDAGDPDAGVPGDGEEPSLTVAGCAVRGVHARNDLNGALLLLMAVALMYRRRSKRLRVKEFSHDQAQND